MIVLPLLVGSIHVKVIGSHFRASIFKTAFTQQIKERITLSAQISSVFQDFLLCLSASNLSGLLNTCLQKLINLSPTIQEIIIIATHPSEKSLGLKYAHNMIWLLKKSLRFVDFLSVRVDNIGLEVHRSLVAQKQLEA